MNYSEEPRLHRRAMPKYYDIRRVKQLLMRSNLRESQPPFRMR